jgi:ribonuclease-3
MSILVKEIPQIEAKLNVIFADKSLLALAFVHRSFENENKKIVDGNNERLEFLGDSILNFIVSEYLYQNLSEEEGILSAIRASLVNAAACVRYVKKLQLDEYLLLGKGEEATGGRKKESLLADVFESVVGAIFLDQGIEGAKDFLLGHFEKDFEEKLFSPEINHKAELQNYCQRKLKTTPLYIVLKEEGPAHKKTFYVAVLLEEEEIGRGEGFSKKEAEAMAAKAAIEKLDIL